MRVYVRHALVGSELRANEPALLLEGAWPAGESALRGSLDDAIDARHAWIDDEASRLADFLAQADGAPILGNDTHAGARPSLLRPGPAYLNELKLRYYLVKLLRVVAFFAEMARDADAIELFAARQRDEDYADLFASLAGVYPWRLRVIWREESAQVPASYPHNAWWRRAAATVSSRTNPSWQATAAPRIVLCGSRRVLDGVCDELVRRGAAVAWLYGRFAVRTWLRWRAFGVGQLVCGSGAAARPMPRPMIARSQPRSISRGIDLLPAVSRWLATMEAERGEYQAETWQSIDDHFDRLRPTHLVLDEDATPLARAAVAAARRHGAISVVVQHGVPRVKFGFAPLAAEYLFAWGDPSHRQFLRWGVPLERVRVVGYPGGEQDRQAVGCRERRAHSVSSPPEILLFATMPPRDERPDAATFHLTSRTHRHMLRMACAAVADIPGARLTIKLHPRCCDETTFRQIAAAHPRLRHCILRGGDLRRLVRDASCVLSCTSSAGIEAAQLGAKVIELVPAGSRSSLPANDWGLLGTAQTEAELRELLRTALDGCSPNEAATWAAGAQHVLYEPQPETRRRVFAAVGREAARRAVDELLAIPSRRDARETAHRDLPEALGLGSARRVSSLALPEQTTV